MMFRPERLGLVGFALVFILAFVFHGFGGGDQSGSGEYVEVAPRRPAIVEAAPRRRPKPATPGPLLPPPSKNDPVVRIEDTKKGNSTGTAFSIGEGMWMTARHVLEGCSTFGIVTGRRRVEKGYRMILNPRHDLATFHTDRSATALGFEPRNLSRNQEAFHFGYPQGKPADVRSRLLGRMNVVHGRGHRGREPVVAWAEIKRVPNIKGSLGGISGGPVVDAEGDVIGVTVAGSPRRGRVFTTAPTGIRDMLDRADATPRTSSRGAIDTNVDPTGFPRIGTQLRDNLTVAKVVCWVN
jgi:S1-C subfamily serine protease